MTEQELDEKLREITPDVYFDHTSDSKVVPLPFIVYIRENSNHVVADNKVFHKMYYYTINVYTTDPYGWVQEQLEAMLNENMIPYSDTMSWDADNLLYTFSYSFTL